MITIIISFDRNKMLAILYFAKRILDLVFYNSTINTQW